MTHRSDAELIEKVHNVSRFFVETRHVAWIALLGTVALGIYGYAHMPKSKDPVIPVRVAAVLCPWPGATAQQVEQLVTRPLEDQIATSKYIRPPNPGDFGIQSLSLPGLSIIQLQLAQNVKDTTKDLNDINLKLQNISNTLPQGAGPINFRSDFGDTAALMLTVASPAESSLSVRIRAQSIQAAIEKARAGRRPDKRASPVSVVICFPASLAIDSVRRPFTLYAKAAQAEGVFRNVKLLSGRGFVGVDALTTMDDAAILENGREYVRTHLQESEIEPDVWPPAIIRDPSQTAAILEKDPGEEYSYHDLDNFTDLLTRTLLSVPEVSKISRAGVLPEDIYLNYSQERLASYGLQPTQLQNILQARNITAPAGVVETAHKRVLLDPSGQFKNKDELGSVVVGFSSFGAPLYLRDLVEISRGYQSPPQYLNFYQWADGSGRWHRRRAVTLAIFMRQGEQIQIFSKHVDEALGQARKLLPADLIYARTSDQPRQTKENIDLFMDALYEAIALVVVASLIGFWEWRSALLMALSIPITLAMTFGMTYVLGIDLQQVSIATLIIALGLLVDDPVVAGDSIKRELAIGQPPITASWLGPTKLARAILYATITNIVAYLPFLMLTGNTGDFLYSLPVVMTCALVASRIASMTFIPLLGYYLLRAPRKAEKTMEEKRTTGFYGFYFRTGQWAIEHRWKVLLGSLVFLVIGGVVFESLDTQFFPEDVQYLFYLDVWLPNDAPLYATNQTAIQVENIIRQVGAEYGKEHPDKDGQPRKILKQITTFVGGGGPRWWFSVNPQLQQLNYSQILVEDTDKDDTAAIIPRIQKRVTSEVPGAIVDVRQLQTNPVDFPLEIRISGRSDVDPLKEAEDIRELRRLSEQVKAIFRSIPGAERVRDDWQADSYQVRLKIDPDRANMAGITNLDVARSATAGISGATVTSLQQGDLQIPVVVRLRPEERGQLSDVQNLYVYASQSTARVPLLQISTLEGQMETQRIRRLDHFRTIQVQAFPAKGILSSHIFAQAEPKLQELMQSLPSGYKIEVSGEHAKQIQGFGNLAIVMAISVFMIFLALVMQFKNAIKPFLVFAATPYGVTGAVIALAVMKQPFGFMGFLGIASLIGVIVSHVIVLFDFIEEMHEKGEPLEQALLDAGIVRLRPVLITVGATVLALFPLALHGGPLWMPLCYAQIGGLSIATFITLLLVPVLYSIFVVDLKIVKWEGETGLPGNSSRHS